jgi:hypothetical protein
MCFSTNHHAFTKRPGRRLTAATVVSAVALVVGLAGCGGSSKSTTATSAATQQAAASTGVKTSATTSAHPAGSTSSRYSKAIGSEKPAKAAVGKGGHIRAELIASSSRAQHGKSVGERPSVLVPQGPNPCVFISGAEAQSIIGSPIAGEKEAPLGPTCVFSFKGQRQTVTIAVESENVATQARYMRKRQRVTVSGHQGYCGVVGRPMLDVSLPGGKLLNVTAPCSVAKALAAKALGRIVG